MPAGSREPSKKNIDTSESSVHLSPSNIEKSSSKLDNPPSLISREPSTINDFKIYSDNKISEPDKSNPENSRENSTYEEGSSVIIGSKSVESIALSNIDPKDASIIGVASENLQAADQGAIASSEDEGLKEEERQRRESMTGNLITPRRKTNLPTAEEMVAKAGGFNKSINNENIETN
jgi:hypothetical protein